MNEESSKINKHVIICLNVNQMICYICLSSRTRWNINV